MDAKAGSKRSRFCTPEPRIFFNVLNALFFTLMLAVFYVGLNTYLNYAYCVVLPNGHMIGYSSILNPNSNGLYRMVLRDPSGKILIRSEFDIQFVRDPDRHDRVLARFSRDIVFDLDGEKLMPAILYLHPNSFDKVDPQYSAVRWSEVSRALSKNESLGSYGAALVYQKLVLGGNFKTVKCGTPWFDRER